MRRRKEYCEELTGSCRSLTTESTDLPRSGVVDRIEVFREEVLDSRSFFPLIGPS